MADATAALVEAIEASGRKVKNTGPQTWLAQCPGHPDNRPSLSIRKGRGQALLFCFAGCTPETITDAVGLRLVDLFDEPTGVEYRYVHQGRTVRSVFRDPSKKFRQRVIEADVVSLYSPPDQDLEDAIESGKAIYIPEGEKDCDTFASIGVTATTSPMGAGSWHKADWSVLEGASKIVIVADDDEAGISRARGLYAHLAGMTIGDVSIVKAKVGNDATDHIVAGYGLRDFVPVVADPDFEERVRDRMRQQKITEEARRRGGEQEWARTRERYEPMTLRSVQELPYLAPDWVIPGLMERGDRMVLVGAEGKGKSYLLRQLAICPAAGVHPFLLEEPMTPVKTFVLDAENTLAQWQRSTGYLLNRVLEHGSADPRDRVVVQTGKRINLVNARAVEQVHRWLDEYEPDLLMIGPLYKMIPGSLNDEDVTARLLGALDEFRERGITLLVEGHAGHGKDDKGDREFRPRGSSMMLGWPEFGLGLKPLGETEAELVKWRGSREERPWPRFIRHGSSGELPWVPSDTASSGDY